MATGTSTRPSFLPKVPINLEKLGIPPSMVTDLMLRRLLIDGTSSLQSMSKALRLAVPIVETVFRQMRSQQLVEVKGMQGNDYNFVLTNAGRSMAVERYQMVRYFGAAPVSLSEYRHGTKMQAAQPAINRRILADAMSDLVITDRMLDQLGPAVVSQTSMFVYGPTGNGKTSIANGCCGSITTTVFIPYAVEVDSQIIILYDPVVHQKWRWTTKTWTRAGSGAAGHASSPEANWLPTCWSCGWTNPPACMPRPCR